jgi:Protein of unknown function (DUF3611)
MSQLSADKLARSFARLGWMGVIVQLLLAVVPVFMLGYFLFGKATGVDVTLRFVDYLSLIGLLILGFTILWSYRYTRLAKRIVDPERRPTRAKMTGTLWVGLWASCLGILVSLLMLVIEVARLLILFLKAPQGGVPVIRTEIESRTGWVSAIDVVSLLTDLSTLIGELMLLGFTLWLLFRLTQFSDDGHPSAVPEP